MYEPQIQLGEQRFRLHGGPYKTPRVRVGAKVNDEVRGEVVVVGMTEGKIRWPLGKQGRHAMFVLFKDLAEAIRTESNIAICHWWGVTPQTVTRWRKALGVVGIVPGTSQLRSAYAQDEVFDEVRKKAYAKAKDPERCEKIAASRRGKSRPPHVIEALRKANLAKKTSDDTPRKKSASQKQRQSPQVPAAQCSPPSKPVK